MTVQRPPRSDEYIDALKCKRCEHEWFPRTPDPLNCPRCHSPYWDVPRSRLGYGKRPVIGKSRSF